MRTDLQRLRRDSSLPQVVRASSPATEADHGRGVWRGRLARGTRTIWIGVALAAVLITYFVSHRTTPTVESEKSIAVLPFVNMSDDKSNEYFSDGISEELLPAALAEIEQETSEGWRTISLSMTYHALGRKADSDAAIGALIAKEENEWPFNIAYVYAFRGEGRQGVRMAQQGS
jgi:hypothetical protein